MKDSTPHALVHGGACDARGASGPASEHNQAQHDGEEEDAKLSSPQAAHPRAVRDKLGLVPAGATVATTMIRE